VKKLLVLAVTVFCYNTGVSNDKIYVSRDQVQVGNDEILINILGNIYPVSGLFRDAQGLHVMAKDLADQHTFSWTCPKGHYSPGGTGMCDVSDCPFRKR
jgi:hypothetical protein